jgi:hypothetical protein
MRQHASARSVPGRQVQGIRTARVQAAWQGRHRNGFCRKIKARISGGAARVAAAVAAPCLMQFLWGGAAPASINVVRRRMSWDTLRETLSLALSGIFEQGNIPVL